MRNSYALGAYQTVKDRGALANITMLETLNDIIATKVYYSQTGRQSPLHDVIDICQVRKILMQH